MNFFAAPSIPRGDCEQIRWARHPPCDSSWPLQCGITPGPAGLGGFLEQVALFCQQQEIPLQNKKPGLQQFGMRAEVRKLLAAAGQRGISRHDIEAASGATGAEAKKAISSLVKRGEAFSGRGRDYLWLYFVDESARDAFVATAAASAAPRVPAPPSVDREPIRYTAGPSRIAPRIAGDQIIDSRTIVTVAQTPLPRFAPDPGYVGPFSQVGVGRDVQTGAAWGA